MTETQGILKKGKDNSRNQKISGGNASLQGKIFDITSKDAINQYLEMVKSIADYVGQEYTHGGDMSFMIENYRIIISFNL
jgi:hypothetical protein